ncbi:MAG TPA: FecR domain-containing protein [Caulobacteraceae bacterium]|nr:FecR domain-containing protein [Caulobacteraceae bacterium]
MSAAAIHTPEEGATYWVARRRLGLMSAADEAAFAAWRADPANAAALADIDGMVDEVGAVAAFSEVRAMRQAALAIAPPRRISGRLAGSIAASLVALVLAGTWAVNLPAAPVSPAVATAVPTQRYVTGVGEQRTMKLTDGSTVALNTASVVEVAYSASRRDIRLLQGQALFEVAHNPARPFVVAAADRRITALGTRFDVRLDGPATTVVLVEGRVKVEPLRPVGLDRLAPVLARRTLEPGEVLVAEPGEGVEVAVADTEQATSWRRGQVIFREDTIGEAVAEMNRYADTQLVVDDPRIAALKISGVFGVTREENFLAALTSFYPIEAVERSPRVTALRWREENSPDR